jgi:hypothetical protein
VGARRAHAAQLTEHAATRRDWPLVVRRARPDDEAAVLEFATQTWDGWDYIPRAWPLWLTASDGVLLVGCHPDTDRPVAVSRMAMLSATEGWVEGIRVDPQVRGLDVATDLQVAELQWAAAQPATIVRYATGSDNLGSHRLGARHGFQLAAEFTSLWHSADPDSDPDDPSAYDQVVRDAATAKRQAALGVLSRGGLVAEAATASEAGLWPWLDADPTFAAARRLYEAKPWCIQELTRAAFAEHLERGEVIVASDSGRRALAILPREQAASEDSSLRLALLVGEATQAVRLLEAVRRSVGETPRVRVPSAGPMLLERSVFTDAGYRSPNWMLHVLARPLGADSPPPEIDPSSVVLADPPEALGGRF